MKERENIIKNIIIFVFLIFVTFLVIFNTHDFKDTMNAVFSVKLPYIILAVILMLGYFVTEAVNIKNILNILGDKVTAMKCLKFHFIGFFFSGITPAASGGQPMEIYYMHKEGIPIPHSTVALLIELCSFHIVTLVCGIFGAIVNKNIIVGSFLWVFIIGMILKVIVLTAMMLGLFSPKLSKKIVYLFLKAIDKTHLINFEARKKSIDAALDEYKESSQFIKDHKSIFYKSLLIVFIQMLFYYSIPFFVYKSFGLDTYNYFNILTIQMLFFVAIASIPLPGTVGVSEGVFLDVYSTIFGATTLASALLLIRGINFYFFMIICFIIVVVNHQRLKRKKRITN